MANYQPQRGTYDAYYEDALNIEKIVDELKSLSSIYGFTPIHIPTYESTSLFARSAGDSSDIVTKEMFNFLDKSGRDICLRPELTAGVMRAIVTNKLYATRDLPLKLSYFGSAFRYERPQAGRLREFHQFGVEFLGSDTADTDAEAILFAKTFFDKLNVKGLTLYINSIGCKKCRAEYETALKNYLSDNLGNLCALCRERFEKNPLRILDCKNEECKKIVENAPDILDYLCDDCKAHFNKVRELLDLAGVEYKIDSKIVRGLDYYTKTVFEFVSENIGAQGTVCGGGRYDGLIEEFGGNRVPGIGFAMGIERLLLLLDSIGVKIPNLNRTEVYIAPMGEEERKKAFAIVQKLRLDGVSAETDHMNRGIKAQFKYADKIGAKFVGVIGSDELAQGKIKIKEMETGAESFVDFNDMSGFVKENRA